MECKGPCVTGGGLDGKSGTASALLTMTLLTMTLLTMKRGLEGRSGTASELTVRTSAESCSDGHSEWGHSK